MQTIPLMDGNKGRNDINNQNRINIISDRSILLNLYVQVSIKINLIQSSLFHACYIIILLKYLHMVEKFCKMPYYMTSTKNSQGFPIAILKDC